MLPFVLLPITVTAVFLAWYFYFASRRARAVLESATEAMIVVAESGTMLCVNGAAERMFGYAAKELRGKPLTLVIPDAGGLFERDGARRFERIGIIRNGPGTAIEVSVGEFAVDGLPRYVLTVRDISGRRRTEEVLRETEAYVQLLVGRLPVIVWVADKQGVVQSMFGSGITSWRETNLPLDELFGGQDAGLLRNGHQSALEGESVRGELKVDGRTFLVAIDPYRNGGSEIRGSTGVAFDTTERTELLEALRYAESMSRLGTFVAGVAHEVRNPLFGISASVDALEAALENHELRQYAVDMRQEVQRMNELMGDLLTYGRPAEPVRERGSLESAVRASASAVRTLAQKQQISMRIAAAPDLLPADIDSSRVQQVFENLLKNAISFSPPGSVVEVRCRNVDGAGDLPLVECTIDDRGPGIVEEDLPHVFEPFFTRRRGGTGLGLAIVDRIVGEHQGQVSLANRDAGGAVATVRLPAAPAESVHGP